MAIRVSATERDPTHDISLSDGTTTIGLHLSNPQGERDIRAIRQSSTPRTSLQIQQGDPGYSGFNLPYTPITQKDWSGGRGQLNYKRDSTRFYDSYGVNTIRGKIVLGGDPTTTAGNYLTGGNTAITTTVASVWVDSGTSTTGYFSDYVVGTDPTTIQSLQIAVGYTSGSARGYWKAEICSDSSGAPGAVFASGDWVYHDNLTRDGNVVPVITLPIAATFAPATTYWLGFRYSRTDSELPWYRNGAYTGKKIYKRYDPGDVAELVATDFSIWVRTVSVSHSYAHIFEYRKAMMAVQTYDDGTAVKLYQNGTRGFAVSNAGALSKLKTNVDLTDVGDLTGCVVQIIAGSGIAERQPWREITANTNLATGNEITVTPDWNLTQSATTEFVIVGTNYWEEITGHSMGGPVTDVAVVDDIIYFAQGIHNYIKRGRLNAGSWSFADDGTNLADFIELIPTTTGTNKIWTARAVASMIYSADPVAWGTNLTLAAKNNSKAIGNPAYPITGLIGFGDPRRPYYFKENGFGSVENDIYSEIPTEIAAVSSENNGRAACVYGTYLFFSLMQGFERFYDQYLDDIGPNRDEGLPTDRQGPIVDAIPYPGGVLVAIDAGPVGYSSVMFWSSATNGWHEIYRAEYGKRITAIFTQVIPGQSYQRLWCNAGSNLVWIPMSLGDDYPYINEGYIITSWYETTLAEVVKFWRDVMLFTENVDSSHAIHIYYQTDAAGDSSQWYQLPAAATTSPVDEVLLSTTYDVTGKRIRLKLKLLSTDTTSPKILATTLNAVTRVPPSKTWSMTFQADDMNIQEGEASYDALDMNGLLSQLEAWADSDQQAAPLIMRSVLPAYDNKYVFIDNPVANVREVTMIEEDRVVKAVGTISLYEA